MINTTLGVKFEDPFCFLLNNEEENPLLPNIQANHDHTSKVTAYKIHQQERLHYFLSSLTLSPTALLNLSTGTIGSHNIKHNPVVVYEFKKRPISSCLKKIYFKHANFMV